ncbi:MAG: hypothetical protein ACKVVP_16380, partial [Chloroflexota bacterium]
SNGLARHMAEQLFGTEGYRLANTACRQQGLLHLFRTNCRVHDCARCPAGSLAQTMRPESEVADVRPAMPWPLAPTA